MTGLLPDLLIDATIKSSIVVAAALAASTLLRRRSAALRHGVLAAALLCAGALPLLQLVVPAWGGPEPDGPVAVLATFTAAEDLPAPPAASTPSMWAVVHALVGPLWLAGFAITVGLLIVGLGRLAWLASRSRPVRDPGWTAVAAEIAARYRIRRPIVLLESDHPVMLVTWGWAVPKILLPAAARGWTADRVRIVLGHELAHIDRRDWAVHIAAAVLRSIYWFNPLVWLACDRLRRESEHACDDAVLNLGVAGTEYATELVDLARAFNARGRSWLPGSPAPAMARRSTLERRVRAMLTSNRNRTPLTGLAMLAVGAVLLAITIPIAGFGAPQTGPASFAGKLVDTVGKMMPDETIVLTHQTTKAAHETRSDASGNFSFSSLQPGDYTIEVSSPGFSPRYRVSLAAGQTLQRDITLQLGTLEETITVTKNPVSVPARVKSDAVPWVRQPRACEQSLKGGCIEQPLKLRDKRPIYPESRAEGQVVKLECRIGTDGVPGRVRVFGPADPEFAKAAAEAVEQWLFSPTYLDGVAVEVDMNVTVNFRLE